jgi:tetratricopeptide (TPR) repeat protein
VRRLLPILLLATATLAQDVYVPPVPIGIKGDGKVRTAKSPIRFPDERKPWVRVRSAHYDVLSSAPAADTRAIVEDLETLASVLTKTSTRFKAAPVPATVLVFADRKESLPYFQLLLGQEKPVATGLYVRHPAGGTMFVDASGRRQGLEKTAMHELVHDLLQQGEHLAPLWIEEGLAEYFSTADIRNGKIIAGAPIRSHANYVRGGMAMSLEIMFAVERESDVSMTPQFYAQSWAAVNWLMRTDRDRFFPFLEALESGTPPADALRTHYGKSLLDLQKGIGAMHVKHQVELTAVRTEVPAPEPLDRATLLFELGRFLSYVSGAGDDAQRHYAEALRVDPRHARTLAAVGRFEEALAAGLNDPDVHLAYAETLLTTALGPFAGVFERKEGDTEKFRKARTLAERALTLGADEGSVRAVLGTTYFVEADLSPGIAELERAHALLPQRNDISLNLYAMLLRTEQFEKAEAFYQKALANVRNKQVVFAARNVRLVAETDRANALIQEGRNDEAAALVRSLAATMEDPAGRRQLEQQAASLESIAAVNRHIVLYNDAIALSNKGKNRDAIKVLDELLAVVQDPQVAREAKRLREELRQR